MEYLQHKPDCYKMQDWSEAEQALGDTPDMFRDSDYYTAVDELINKRNTCSCGFDLILTYIEKKEEEMNKIKQSVDNLIIAIDKFQSNK